MVYLPIVGAFLEAVGMILEKKILKRKNFDFRNYTTYEFLAIVVVMLPMLYFVWGVDAAALEWKNLAIFLAVVLISVLANLLIFYSLKREKITEFEPVWLMQPLFTIILAFIFFASERKWGVVVLALIASISLVLSHVKKHHLSFDRYILAALFGGLLFSLELVISRFILNYYSPFSFYFLRCLLIFVITFAIFRPNFKPLKEKKASFMILLVGLTWMFYRAIIYYGYLTRGIVFTTTLFILSPVLMFLFAIIFLKERPDWKHIVATIIILVCVVATILLG
jgi:drug/metabolite transporter (DMT)-like permease